MNARAEIKICGMTQEDDVRLADELGVDFVGFILFPGSPRHLSAAAVVRLLDRVRPTCRAVGVFVNESRATVEAVAADARLYAVQLHGDETPESFASLGVPVWRAVRVVPGAALPGVDGWNAARYVLDSAAAGRYGGTGTTGDWALAAEFARRYPTLLAGGLNPGNVAEAIRTVRPLGVDVASGVEREPGRKDPAAMRAFVRAVRALEAGI